MGWVVPDSDRGGHGGLAARPCARGVRAVRTRSHERRLRQRGRGAPARAALGGLWSCHDVLLLTRAVPPACCPWVATTGNESRTAHETLQRRLRRRHTRGVPRLPGLCLAAGGDTPPHATRRATHRPGPLAAPHRRRAGRSGVNGLIDGERTPESGHQGTTPLSSKSRPVGPSSGRVASRMAIAAPCSGVWVPLNPLRSVAT